jgi:hypothetical protein
LVAFAPEHGAAIKHELPVDMTVGHAALDDKIETIDVKYLPENPNVVFPAIIPPPSSEGFYVGGILSLFGLSMLVYALRKKPASEKIAPASA